MNELFWVLAFAIFLVVCFTQMLMTTVSFDSKELEDLK